MHKYKEETTTVKAELFAAQRSADTGMGGRKQFSRWQY